MKLKFGTKKIALWGSVCVGVALLTVGGFSIAQQAAAPAAEPTVVGGPAQLRRLTEAQYRATVADIFAPDIEVVGRFEPGQRTDGLLSIGASRASISPFSIEQYDISARNIAAAVVSEERRATLVPCQVRSATRYDSSCATRFVNHYGEALFRRPLTRDERSLYTGIAQRATRQLGDFYKGLEHALVGMMVSPDFLLRVETTEADPTRPGEQRLDAYSRATRLSYFLTNSSPDRELLRAAGAGELNTQEGLTAQVDRLMSSPRYPTAVRAFFADMLQFEGFNDLAKDPVIYPAFNSTVSADAQEQTLRTLVDVLVTQNGDYRDIFTTRHTNVTRALGAIYSMPVATRNGWEQRDYPVSTGRAGILTDVSFLALHSHPGRSSATLRGKAIRQVFMCQNVPDPPPNVDFSVVQDPSNRAMPTARDRLSGHQTQPACVSCHRLTDPLGLTLEQFDGTGGFRTRENDTVIDASGSLDGVEFNNAAGLGQALHDNPQTARCVVQRLYSSGLGRGVSRADRPVTDYLNQSFAANGYRIPDLMRTIALSRSFYAVSAEPAEAPTEQRAEAPRTNGEGS